MRDQPIVDAHGRTRPFEQLDNPAPAGHVAVIVIEADPGQAPQRGRRGFCEGERARAVNGVSDAADASRDDAGEVWHLFPDQESGLATREVRELADRY